jgi:hypothetical protein
MTPCNLVGGTKILEEHTASIFRARAMKRVQTTYHTTKCPKPEDKNVNYLTVLCIVLNECGTKVKQSAFPYTECNGTYCHVTSEVVSDKRQNTYERS